MPRPRLSIRTFLVVCLLLGDVAVPVGCRQYQKWKAANKTLLGNARDFAVS